jgi:hypothetical protein
MSKSPPEMGRSWAVPTQESEGESEIKAAQTLSFWRRLTYGLAGISILLLGVVVATLPQALSYGAQLDENLLLTQRVQAVEVKLAEVDHILVQMRLHDAQMKGLVGSGGDFDIE